MALVGRGRRIVDAAGLRMTVVQFPAGRLSLRSTVVSVSDVSVVTSARVGPGRDVENALCQRVTNVRFVAGSYVADVAVAVVAVIAAALIVAGFVQDAGRVHVTIVSHVAGVLGRDLRANQAGALVSVVALTAELVDDRIIETLGMHVAVIDDGTI